MDQSCINLPRISDAYERGVEEFIKFAQRNVDGNHTGVRMRCPCLNCLNRRTSNVFNIKEHLLCDEISEIIQHRRGLVNYYTCQMCIKLRSLLIQQWRTN